ASNSATTGTSQRCCWAVKARTSRSGQRVAKFADERDGARFGDGEDPEVLPQATGGTIAPSTTKGVGGMGGVILDIVSIPETVIWLDLCDPKAGLQQGGQRHWMVVLPKEKLAPTGKGSAEGY